MGHAQRGRGGNAPNDPPVPQLNLTPNPRIDQLKDELIADIESRRVFTQQMVDTIFSFSELGFQEVETQRYVTDILVKEGFEVQRAVAGVPTSWTGKYGIGPSDHRARHRHRRITHHEPDARRRHPEGARRRRTGPR